MFQPIESQLTVVAPSGLIQTANGVVPFDAQTECWGVISNAKRIVTNSGWTMFSFDTEQGQAAVFAPRGMDVELWATSIEKVSKYNDIIIIGNFYTNKQGQQRFGFKRLAVSEGHSLQPKSAWDTIIEKAKSL